MGYTSDTYWISCVARVGEMAEEIRRGRVRLSKDKPETLRPIGESWLHRFKARNPDITGIWTRQIDTARYRATSYDGVNRWFDAVTELWMHNQYDPSLDLPLEPVSRPEHWSVSVSLVVGNRLAADKSG